MSDNCQYKIQSNLSMTEVLGKMLLIVIFTGSALMTSLMAQGSDVAPALKESPIYYPNTEVLKPDEM